MRVNLEQLSVRPANKIEESRYRKLMQQYHYLGNLTWIGWDFRHQYGHLNLIVNNSRFLILPE